MGKIKQNKRLHVVGTRLYQQELDMLKEAEKRLKQNTAQIVRDAILEYMFRVLPS